MVCTKCEHNGPDEDFVWKNKGKGKRNPQCRKCTSSAIRKHYKKNKQYYIRKKHKHAERIRELIIEAKNAPCTDCGKEYPFYVMDLDHIENKSFAVSAWRRNSKGYQQVRKEIAKCEVVCSNCYRIRTHAGLV